MMSVVSDFQLSLVEAVVFWWAGEMCWYSVTFSPSWIEASNGYFVTTLAPICLKSLFPIHSAFLRDFCLCNQGEFGAVSFQIP